MKQLRETGLLLPALSAALALLALGSCSPSGGSPGGTAAAPAAPAAATPAPAPGEGGEKAKPAAAEVRSLAELPDAVARLEKLRESVGRVLVADADEKKASAELEAAREVFVKARAKLDSLPDDDLREIHRLMTKSGDWVASTEAVILARLGRIDRRILRAAGSKEEMTGLSKLAEEDSTPAAIRERIARSLALLDQLEAQLKARRGAVLLEVDSLAEVRAGAAAFAASAEARIEAGAENAARLSREPIWRLRFAGVQAFDGASKRLRRDVKRVATFAAANGAIFLLVPLAVFGATGLLLRGLRGQGSPDPAAGTEPAAHRIRQISWVAAVPLTVALLVVLAPTGPPAFYAFALLPAAPAAAWIVVKILGTGMGRTVWVLAASLAVLPLRGALESFPLFGRIVFLLQTIPLAAVLVLDFRAARATEVVPGARWGTALGKVARLLAAVLAAAAACMVGGWLVAATRLGMGALETLAGMVVAAATYLVLVEVLRAALASERAKGLLSVRHHAADVLAFGSRLLRFVALAAIAVVALVAFELGDPLLHLLRQIFRTSLPLGSMSISVGGILSFAIVLAVAFLLNRVVSFLLSREILPRLTLARGMAFAVSVVSRYLILLGGFVLAAGAAGIDLSKVGFLAGALGVGLGFGLQNIVGNFISGLILLFERPIQVGDTVDISGTVGSVTDIGIRASTVRSADGAEVVVPNQDLITKPLVNWTLTDSHRRFDVGVGVAYGSPLEGTAQALLAAAGRTPGVLGAPAPEAFLQSFGASSLDWTVRVWIGLAEAPRVLSDLKRAVSEELDRAGIEVPFPQQDLRIRSVSPEAREALRESGSAGGRGGDRGEVGADLGHDGGK